MTLKKTLAMAKAFRERHAETPLILMGYYNPIYIYGAQKFLDEAAAIGVDGLIIVDLPPEEDEELCLPAKRAGSASSALLRQPAMKHGCLRLWPRPAASSIMCPLPGSLEQKRCRRINR